MISPGPKPESCVYRLSIGRLLCALLFTLAGCEQVTQQGGVPGRDREGAVTAPGYEPLSGSVFQSDEIQTLQADEFANPGLLWVDRGMALWRETHASGSCHQCHGRLVDMVGVATRFPRFDEASGSTINLTQQIARCRTEHLGLSSVPYESETLLALTAAVAMQSRGLPFAVDTSGPAIAAWQRGRDYFHTRRGQMNLSCQHCHELNAGKRLRGERLSQGQSVGYPTYRLQWQTLGSLHRRLRFCNSAIRAQPFAYGAQEYVDLELYLAWRGGGLGLEAPAVRR